VENRANRWRTRAWIPILHYVLAIGVSMAAAILLFRRLFVLRDRVLVGQTDPFSSTDYNGTVWFYWWLERATRLHQSILWTDRVCAPTGQSLGINFPNRVDAWLAYPLFSSFSFPENYNLFVLLIPVISTLSAYFFFRTVTRSWWISIAGALLFGFNAYTFYEIRSGRPVTGMIFVIPLVLGAWQRTLLQPSALRALPWAALTGVGAALTTNAYLPFVLWLFPLCVLIGLGSLIQPYPHVSRFRPTWSALLAFALGVLLSMPYVHEMLIERQVRSAQQTQAEKPKDPPGLLDGKLWSDIAEKIQQDRAAERAGPPPRPLGLGSPALRRSLENSMSIDWLIGYQPGNAHPRTWLPPALFFAALLAAPVAGRRGIMWLLFVILSWLFTLGPYAAFIHLGHYTPLELFGKTWKLPTLTLLELIPPARDFLRPYRAFPFVLLGTITLIACAGDALENTIRRRLDDSRKAVPARLGLTLILVASLMGTLFTIRQREGFRMPMTWWKPYAFHVMLGEEGRQGVDDAIVELPMGVGHATSIFQLVHQRPRTENHLDYLNRLRTGQPPPSSCFQHPLLRRLWHLQSRAGYTALAEASSTPADLLPADLITSARSQGLRYILLYDEGFKLLEPKEAFLSADALRSLLLDALGPPIHHEEGLDVYELPSASSPKSPKAGD